MDMFTREEVKAVRFYDLAKEEFVNKDIEPLSKAALEKRMDRPGQVILVRLKHKASGKNIHIASVHLMWGNLEKPDVQTMQGCSSVRALQKFTSGVDDDPIYIIAGDFNTPPTFPLYQMLEEMNAPNAQSREMLEKVPYTREDGKLEYMVNTLEDLYRIDLKLVSSYKHIVGLEPEVTNLDDGFKSVPYPLCLDYIWFSPATLHVSGVLETPPMEDLTKHGGLPSVLFGSDHLPLLTEFNFC